MSINEYPWSFRINGDTRNKRMRVDAAAAFDAYRRCDSRARVNEESYLGIFQFDEEFVEHLERVGSTRGFTGATWANNLWFDIDRSPEEGGIERAIIDTQRLLELLQEQYFVPIDCTMPFISGGKGCHLGLPTRLWSPEGGEFFHLVAREFAERIATQAGVTIDTGIYDRVRAFRSPNSRHPRTGLHKRFVKPEHFGLLTLEDAMMLAAAPAPFCLPDDTEVALIASLAKEWEAASQTVAARQAAFQSRLSEQSANTSAARVNRLTLELIRGEPVAVGDRHRLIYSAARNLAEAGASKHLIEELLREPALDTGLPPSEVERQLHCGFVAVASQAPHLPANTTPDSDPLGVQ